MYIESLFETDIYETILTLKLKKYKKLIKYEVAGYLRDIIA